MSVLRALTRRIITGRHIQEYGAGVLEAETAALEKLNDGLQAFCSGASVCEKRFAYLIRVSLILSLINMICFTGINWKIVSTYEPKITLTHSPA